MSVAALRRTGRLLGLYNYQKIGTGGTKRKIFSLLMLTFAGAKNKEVGTDYLNAFQRTFEQLWSFYCYSFKMTIEPTIKHFSCFVIAEQVPCLDLWPFAYLPSNGGDWCNQRRMWSSLDGEDGWVKFSLADSDSQRCKLHPAGKFSPGSSGRARSREKPSCRCHFCCGFSSSRFLFVYLFLCWMTVRKSGGKAGVSVGETDWWMDRK